MKLTFFGAAMMVTGSSYLLETEGKKILIDCGMFQGSKTVESLNRRGFSYEPGEIDAVLLTHAHIDHSGLLPRLCKDGYKGKIYTTKVTRELCGIMLPDSAHIQEYDAEMANRKGKRLGKAVVVPLYTIADAYQCLQQFESVNYREKMEIVPGLTVQFQDAGHILGSALIEVFVTEHGETTKLVFSGDIGQPNQPLLNDPTYLEQADYVITESTYGNRQHEVYDRAERLAEIINETVNRGGNIVIPSFAVGRTQTLLYYLHQLYKAKRIPDIPVIIDSPLAISATDIFMHHQNEYDQEAYDMLVHDKDHPLKLPHLKFTKTADESKAINSMPGSAIIISASGMADAGRILHHLKHNLWRSESSVLFVGYQAQGSLGRRILEGAKRVKIVGEEVSVKAQLYNLDGFSAHADQGQLLHWLEHFQSKLSGVFIVHGELASSEPFSKLIEEKLQCSTYIPRYGDEITLSAKTYTVKPSEIVFVEPAVRQVQELFNEMETEYRGYRQRVERQLAKEPSHAAEILRMLTKVAQFFKKDNKK